MTDWHGWSVNHGPALHIGHLPGRKQVVLYVVEGSVLTSLAFFPTEEAAEKALALLDALVEARS